MLLFRFIRLASKLQQCISGASTLAAIGLGKFRRISGNRSKSIDLTGGPGALIDFRIFGTSRWRRFTSIEAFFSVKVHYYW